MRGKISSLIKNRFIANTSWILFERIFQMVISLVVGMLTARYLGPSNYGTINYVAAFIAFATPVCSLGLEGLLVKRFVDTPERTNTIIGTAIAMEFIVGIISSFVICVIVCLSNFGDETKVWVAFLESLRLLFKSTEVIEYWYQSRLQSRTSSIIKMIGYIGMSLYRIILLVMGKSVIWFAFATSLDMLIIAILYLWSYAKNSNQKLRIDFSYGFSMLHESYHFILSGLMVVLYSQMDKIMIQHMLSDSAVGLYSASNTICNLWFFIPGALITSAQPIIMRQKQIDEGRYYLRLKQLYASVFWLGIFVGAVVSLCSNQIISILYGKDYIGAVGSLIIGIWYGTFAQLGNARGIWILCEEKQKYSKYYIFLGAIMNLVLNWLLIPLAGINGAAFATLITQVFVCVFAPLFFKETRVHTRILIEGVSLSWLIKTKNKSI